MNKQVLVLACIILSVVCVVAQPSLPWNDVIYLGQSSPTTRIPGLSANNLRGPPSLGVIGSNLIVSDYENLRVLAYNLNNIATFDPAYAAINAPSLLTTGSYSSNGIEPYEENGVQYVWVGTVGTNGNPDNLVRYTLPLNTNKAADPVSFTGVTFATPQGAEVDVANQLIYAVDTGNNRVIQYSTSDLSTPLRIFGQASLSETQPNRGGAASAQTLNNPSKVILGCNNDLYIADTGNSRILYYSNTDTTARYVIGQTDFTTTTAGSAANKLNRPLAAVINSDCSFLWVADTFNNRILKFDVRNFAANAVNGISAVGQVGSTTSTGPAADRFRPTDIDLDENTGRLWVADSTNNRVLGALTSNIASPSPSISVTSTASLSSTSTASLSSTSTASLSSTSTASLSSTSTASLSATPSVSASSAASQSATSTASLSSTSTASLSATSSVSASSAASLSSTSTSSLSSTSTASLSATPTSAASQSSTSTASLSSVPSASSTSAASQSSTSTASASSVASQSATSTASLSSTSAPSQSSTSTASYSSSNSKTSCPSATATATASPPPSESSSPSYSATSVASASSTSAPSASSTSAPSASSTSAPSASSTSAPSASSTSAPSASSAPSVSASAIPSITSRPVQPSVSPAPASPSPVCPPPSPSPVCPPRTPSQTPSCHAPPKPSCGCGGGEEHHERGKVSINFYFADMLRGL